MADLNLSAELTTHTRFPQYRETQQNPTWDDIQSAIGRVVAFGPLYNEDQLNSLFPSSMYTSSSRERASKQTYRYGYLEMTSWGTKPDLHKCYLKAQTPVETKRFTLEAKVQYRYSTIRHVGTGSAEHVNEITARFGALLHGESTWRNGLEWRPSIPGIAPAPPEMLLEIARPPEFFEDRWRDPTPDQLITALRSMKYKADSRSPVAQLIRVSVQPAISTETIKATKLSNLNFSLMYEGRSEQGVATHQCTLVPLTAKQIIETFLSYLREENDWRYKLPWSPPFEQQVMPSSQPVALSKASTGVVYLLRAGSHYKIGKTIDPKSRYETLDIQLPWKPERVHEITTNNIHRLERHWHHHFADRRDNGEWFNLTTDDAEEFCAHERVDYK